MITYNFYNNNIPYQIRLNNKSLSSINNTIKLEDELNTIEIIWNKILTDLKQMFAFCDKIESIDFSNFDFSQVTTTKHLMYECRGLKYVNFGNANLTEVREMSYMFCNCSSLEKVDNCFQTYKVQTIERFFFSCSSLKSIDLSNLYTPYLLNMLEAFAYFEELETIELPNFNNSDCLIIITHILKISFMRVII